MKLCCVLNAQQWAGLGPVLGHAGRILRPGRSAPALLRPLLPVLGRVDARCCAVLRWWVAGREASRWLGSYLGRPGRMRAGVCCRHDRHWWKRRQLRRWESLNKQTDNALACCDRTHSISSLGGSRMNTAILRLHAFEKRHEKFAALCPHSTISHTYEKLSSVASSETWYSLHNRSNSCHTLHRNSHCFLCEDRQKSEYERERQTNTSGSGGAALSAGTGLSLVTAALCCGTTCSAVSVWSYHQCAIVAWLVVQHVAHPCNTSRAT